MNKQLDIVIALPALDEAAVLRDSVTRIVGFLRERMPRVSALVVIADNGSTDGTEAVGRELAAAWPDSVAYLRTVERGKGLALDAAWRTHPAAFYAFMDADLATDLEALPRLLEALRGGADVVVGSRFHRDAQVQRTLFRRALSFGYRALLGAVLDTRVTDLPCGFKGFSVRAMEAILPQALNRTWFYDSELVLRAERSGFRVSEIPVTWSDKRTAGDRSRVRVWRLVREYVSETLRLRRELRHAGEDRTDRRVWAAVSAGLMFVTSMPPLFAWWHGRAVGLSFSGRQFFATGDTSAYLSYIAQARDGAFFLRNLATTMETVSAPHPIWWLAGQLAKLPYVEPLGAYHLLRLSLIPVAVAAMMRAVAWFMPGKRERLAAIILLCFSSGVGALAAAFMRFDEASVQVLQAPTDLWVAESGFFASSYYSPHFVASWTLLVLTLFLLSRAFARRSYRDAAACGLAAAALFSFHPFYVPTVGLVGLAWFVLSARRGGFDTRLMGTAATAALLSAPVAAYQAWLAWFTVNHDFMVGPNILLTPRLVHVIAGFGLLIPLALFAPSSDAAKAGAWPRQAELWLWVVIGLLAAHLPFSFQRRLLEGLQFPLAILSAPAVVALLRNAASRHGARVLSTAVAVATATWLLFLTPFELLYRDFKTYAAGSPIAYHDSDAAVMLDWIADSTPRNSALIARLSIAHDILGRGARRVYAGHWAMTPDLAERLKDTERFFSGGEASRGEFMRDNGLSYAVLGPDDTDVLAGLMADSDLHVAYAAGGYTVFALSERPAHGQE